MSDKPAKARRGRHEGGVTKLPSGSYRVTLSLGKDRDGKRVRESVTAPTKGEALEAARRRMAELGPSGAGAAERGLTFGQWFARWMKASESRIGAAASRCRRSRSRHMTAGPLAGVPLARLRSAHVAAWLAAIEQAGTPAPERIEILTLLKTSLNDAVREGLITSSPADKVRGPKRTKPDRRSLSPEQARAALEAAEGGPFTLYLRVALDSGCRPGELLALRPDDLDGRVLCVQRSLEIVSGRLKRPKTDAGVRRIILAPQTAERLSRQGGSDWLVGRPESNPYKGWLYQGLCRLFASCGVPWAVPYTTRHTCATLLLRAGVPITTVAQRLGHADASITLRHYAHAIPGDQERAAEVTARLFG